MLFRFVFILGIFVSYPHYFLFQKHENSNAQESLEKVFFDKKLKQAYNCW